MKIKGIINGLLVVVALVLVYFLFDSLSQPIKFSKECKVREAQVVAKLKDIREAQALFKNEYGHYTADFDSLINFIEEGRIPIVNIIPDPNDTTFTKTINDTVGFETVAERFTKRNEKFNAKTLAEIPFSNNEKFHVEAGFITRGGLKVAVVEVNAPYSTFLYGLDDQRIRNLAKQQEDINKYAGLKFGSMTEASDAGNWE